MCLNFSFLDSEKDDSIPQNETVVGLNSYFLSDGDRDFSEVGFVEG